MVEALVSQRTIALFASSRRKGNTGRFMDCIAESLGIEVIDLSDRQISEFDYEHRNRHDDFEGLMQRVFEFDQIIFASPVYWYSVAPKMKTFLDRISDLLSLPDLRDQRQRLHEKTAFVVCTSVYPEVPRPFIEAFEETFRYLDVRFGGYAHADCRMGFDPAAHADAVAGFVKKVAA